MIKKGKKCGNGYIPRSATCQKTAGGGVKKLSRKKKVAVALTAGALAGGALAVATFPLWSKPKHSFKPRNLTGSNPPSPKLLRAGQIPLLRGSSPKGLLPGTPPRALLRPQRPKSKTQRMRENTRASMKVAESRIGQTAREEIRRIGQIGNTMAATGEATGNIFKTTARELRLRAEAARRKYEPGYRKATARSAPKFLSPGTLSQFNNVFTAKKRKRKRS